MDIYFNITYPQTRLAYLSALKSTVHFMRLWHLSHGCHAEFGLPQFILHVYTEIGNIMLSMQICI